MDPSFKSRVIEWTKQTKKTSLACDWRLHTEFGGMFDDLPDMSLEVVLPSEPGVLKVLWKTSELPSINSNPLETSIQDFKQWVNSDPSEVGVRMGYMETDKKTVTPHVASVLNTLSNDDPIAVWHKRNNTCEKANRYVLFRKEPLPFSVGPQTIKDPVCEDNNSDDDI